MNAVRAIAISTLIEQRRQRLLLVPLIGFGLSMLLLVSALLVNGDASLHDTTEGELTAWIAGIGAAIALSVYAIVVGAGLIARELGAGTMLMLGARPIGRWTIVLGRVVGAATFLLATLVAACIAYGLVATLLTGSIETFDEPLRSLRFGAPGLLLALIVGVAFSIQGKATAAIGSAMAVCMFATFVGNYASGWLREEHLRSYLTDDVREELPSHNPVVGRGAVLVTRALPFFVILNRVGHELEEREGSGSIVLEGQLADGRIDTRHPGWTTMAMPAEAVAESNAAPAAEPAPLPAGPPDVDADDLLNPEVVKLPDDPDANALECANWNGAQCLIGYRNAWTRRYLPRPPELDDGTGMTLAWLAIPLWLGVAVLLLHRRRDLTD